MNFRIALFLAAFGVVCGTNAQTRTNNFRPLALDEAIQLALEHNLDVQIERVNPLINTFNLRSAYAPYDPVFGVRVDQGFQSQPGGFDRTTGLQIPGNETWNESLRPSLSGALPSGLTYNIGGDLANRTSGRSFGIDTNGVIQSADRGFQYRPSVGIDLNQPLLKDFWIDATRQQIWVNKKTLKISELGVQFQVMDVVRRVEQAYYDLIFAMENVRVQEKALELANRLLSENKRRVEVGALAPLDEQQAGAQAAGRSADLLTARRDLDAQQNVLKNLITDDYKEWHALDIQPLENLEAIPETFDLMESWQKGMTQRPDLLQRRIDLERTDIILRYERNQLFPQLDLIGSYGRNGLDRHWGGALGNIRDETNPTFSYGVLFSIPLSNQGPRNKYRATKAQKEQALLQLKQFEQNVLVQIDDAVKLAQTSFQRVGATKQARIYAEAALNAEGKKLENGKSTSFVVLQLQRDLTTARSEEIRALSDYNKSLAQLAFNQGSTLERNRLNVNTR
ncbi:MAG: TolC family protein [Verrucomicrobiota bacterium]